MNGSSFNLIANIVYEGFRSYLFVIVDSLDMELKPSDIYYSQDSINNVFDKRSAHSYRCIGETLDDLCEHRSVYTVRLQTTNISLVLNFNAQTLKNTTFSYISI